MDLQLVLFTPDTKLATMAVSAAEGLPLGLTSAASLEQAQACLCSRPTADAQWTLFIDLRAHEHLRLRRWAQERIPSARIFFVSAEATPSAAGSSLSCGGPGSLSMDNGEWIPRPEETADWTALFARLLGETAGGPAVEEIGCFDDLVGRSIGFRTAVETALAVAPTEEPVLLTGESGSGKGSFARAMHHESGRAPERFIELDCRTLSAGVLERLLHWSAAERNGAGFEGMAFPSQSERPLTTGNDALPASAEDATVYLRDISALDRALQARLARWMDARRLADVSDTERAAHDGRTPLRKRQARIIAGAGCDLSLASRTGAFDRNLYRRLSEHEIQIPPLRERPTDVLLLATHLLERLSARWGGMPATLTAEAKQRLASHSWPGNVRELIGVLQIAMLKSGGARAIDETHLSHGLRAPRPASAQASGAPAAAPSEGEHSGSADERGVRFHGHEVRIDLPEEGVSFDDIEKAILQAALTRARGNVVRAARLLKLGRGSLRYRLEKHSINQPRRRRRSRRRTEEGAAAPPLSRAS